MSCDLSIHGASCNFLQRLTEEIGAYLREHPHLYKIVLLVNHVFRAVSMLALSLVLPFSPAINTLICFASSLFYRVTVETHCAFKFALPAFAGSLAFPPALAALMDLISGVAFASLGAFALTCLCLVPLVAYFSYIALTVSHEVDQRCQPEKG